MDGPALGLEFITGALDGTAGVRGEGGATEAAEDAAQK